MNDTSTSTRTTNVEDAHNPVTVMDTTGSLENNSNSDGNCTGNEIAASDSTMHSGGGGGSGCMPLSNDARLEFITSFTLTSLRLKHDKWHKMMATQEYQLILLDWLNNPQRLLLVMTLSPAGHLIPKKSINDLYQQSYAILMPSTIPAAAATTTTTTATTSAAPHPIATLSNNETALTYEEGKRNYKTATIKAPAATSIAAVAATAAMTAATALLAPLPPPSSSFSTLDGVPRGKCTYFLKRHMYTILTKDNYRREVICGDLPIHSKIETLATLFDEILQPLLQNPLNRKQWPEVVSKDLHGRMKDVRNTLTEIKGKTNNRTILSLLVSPTVIEHVANHTKQGNLKFAMESKFRSQLEEMFINWTTQMHEILQEKTVCTFNTTSAFARTSAKTFTVTVNVPQQEINFWLSRQQNLQNIYDQLRRDCHKSLAFILESIDSCYYPPFMKIFKKLVYAWQEAKDITLWLQPILRQTATFNAVNFSSAQELIEPLIHVIHLIWSNARHYRTTQRMTVLLRCICNLMVRRAGEDLEVGTLFQTDADEGLSKITRTITILEQFKSKLLEYKAKYTSNQTILPALPHSPSSFSSSECLPMSASSAELQQLWRFSNDDVFGLALNGFMEQLEELKLIFETAVTFQSLEKLEIGGCLGKVLTDRLHQIHNEFKLLFEEWTKLEINLGQQQQQQQQPNANYLQRQTFKRKEMIFFEHMNILEKKLATILQQAFNDCHNWEQLRKLTTMFANIVQRQSIQTELMVILPHIFTVLRKELLLIENIVGEVLLAFECRGVEAIPMEMNFPTIAGAMMWLENYMKRCDAFAGSELNALITTLLTADNLLSSQYEKLTSRRDILTTKLSNLQLKIWNNWLQTIEERIAKGLDSKLIMLLLLSAPSAPSALSPPSPHCQQQYKCEICCERSGIDEEENHEISMRDDNIDASVRCSKKVTNTGLARTQSNFHTATNETAYCHHVDTTALAGKTHTMARFKKESNVFPTLQGTNKELTTIPADEYDVLDKSPVRKEMKILEVNLSVELFTLLKETKYLLALQEIHKRQKQSESSASSTSTAHDLTTQLTASQGLQHEQQEQQQHPHQLPLALLNLYTQRDIFWQRNIKLMKIAEYYNNIREGFSASHEMQLIQPHLDVIDERVECASKTLTWRMYDAALIDEIFKETQTLHSRLQESRKNVQTILESVRRWSRQPLHQRSLYGKNLLELRHQKERLRTRVLQCEETNLLLNRLLIENFCLFFESAKQEKDVYDKSILEFLRSFPSHQRTKYTLYLKTIDELIYQEVKHSMKIRLQQIF